ncbi:uncharacterized protein AKAW2_70004A [Aspergillus luchuensis]|uniref:Uncharacterized protein n=1 Tax=Aspergillus kawachii TaxID=1069201 RepID=A0A7R7WHV3_ASPKA|nr:uncharacterized protein AKAW2_70004A [Aspergillus luchuensis]BCS03126.1 hypothetical protein AKAW2_70004A [Aspergillus luchuensis]
MECSSMILEVVTHRQLATNVRKLQMSAYRYGPSWTKPLAIESLDWLHLLAQGSTLGVACPKSGFDQEEYELQPTSRPGAQSRDSSILRHQGPARQHWRNFGTSRRSLFDLVA